MKIPIENFKRHKKILVASIIILMLPILSIMWYLYLFLNNKVPIIIRTTFKNKPYYVECRIDDIKGNNKINLVKLCKKTYCKEVGGKMFLLACITDMSDYGYCDQRSCTDIRIGNLCLGHVDCGNFDW